MLRYSKANFVLKKHYEREKNLVMFSYVSSLTPSSNWLTYINFTRITLIAAKYEMSVYFLA